MKRISTLLLFMLFAFSLSVIPATAQVNEKVSIEYMDDGSYFVTTITQGSMLTRAAKSGNKSTSYYNASGTKRWTLTVTGYFDYNGSTSKATSASADLTTHVSGCLVGSKGASTSGNSATAYAAVDGIYKSVTLTCSANSTLS